MKLNSKSKYGNRLTVLANYVKHIHAYFKIYVNFIFFCLNWYLLVILLELFVKPTENKVNQMKNSCTNAFCKKRCIL